MGVLDGRMFYRATDVPTGLVSLRKYPCGIGVLTEISRRDISTVAMIQMNATLVINPVGMTVSWNVFIIEFEYISVIEWDLKPS